MRRLFLDVEIDSYNELLTLQGYEETKRKRSLIKGYSYVYYEKKKEVDPRYNQYVIKSSIPTLYMIIPLVIAFILATTFLILNFTLKDFDKLLFFFSLMLPAFLFVLTATLLSIFKYFNNVHNIDMAAKIMLLKKEEVSK